MSVTKNTKTVQEYQQWPTGEINNGDVLGIEESLGHAAGITTIESNGGQTILRINVCRKVHHTQESRGNTWIPNAAFITAPYLMDEYEDTTVPDIYIADTDVIVWEEPVYDIKIISKAPNLRITVR